jgi:hypothetical protein
MHESHGESRVGHWTPEYRTWASIKCRCFNPKQAAWKWYGGRGITMCEKWKNSYLAFLADVGRKPKPKYTLDRIDNNGNYEPGNVRWTTYHQQMLNKRHPNRLPVILCPICNMSFKKRRRAQGCCSRTCAQEFRARHLGRVTIPCDICGDLFTRLKSRVTRSSSHVCSAKCLSTWRKQFASVMRKYKRNSGSQSE